MLELTRAEAQPFNLHRIKYFEKDASRGVPVEGVVMPPGCGMRPLDWTPARRGGRRGNQPLLPKLSDGHGASAARASNTHLHIPNAERGSEK